MRKTNGIRLIEIEETEQGVGNPTKLSKLVGAACDRFFVSRGLSYEFNPDVKEVARSGFRRRSRRGRAH